MKRTMFITMLAAALLGAQGRAADEIPTSITGYTHTQEDFPHLLYYGKYSESGDVTGGSVGIQADESAEDQYNSEVYGGFSASGSASANNVTIDSGRVLKIYGGQSYEEYVSGNTVTMNGGRVDSWLYGGYSNKGEVNGNSVTMNGGDPWKVLGGYSIYGDSVGNSISAIGVTPSSSYTTIYGGESSDGNAKGNKVSVVESKFYWVEGGMSLYRHAQDNTVTITDSQIDTVYGGYAYGGQPYGGEPGGDSTGNTVIIEGSQITSLICGGSAGIGEAGGNTVTITDSLISGSVEGARAADASGNKVTITDSQMQLAEDKSILGGYATSRDATGNSVTITGTEFLGDYLPEVMGGHAAAGNAGGNSVDMTGGHGSSVYVGRGLASANENKVNLTNAQVYDYVYGGQSDEGDANGNTVTVTNSQVGVIAAAEGYNTVGNTAVMSGGKADSIGGGLSNGGENSGNTVIVTEGVVQYGIIGGHLWNGGELRDNRVYLVGKGATATIGGQQYTGGSSGIQAGSIAAAYALEDGVGEPADLISGNAIDVYGTAITAGRMYGMQILNFHIMEGLANFEEAAMVSITGTVESDRLDLTSVQLGFYGESVEDWSAFTGKSVTLVEAAQEILGVDSGTQVDIMIGDRVVGAAALVLGSGNKTLSLENIVYVPEPATGTLGLLALAALAARRRKNQSTK